ncbi:hypothetical protein H072_378 [Dactylellina haptotyla CBS 200.50]|uniref:UBL3-like ubiquitin domain-containing protein n=1 Tax=Dactylellina haptotyla (strain CBS 200.50) TaxID=1284197 RepID=S8ARL2_DACHA|nr:hypothetical protein H072_378 [Dactylellina haptotyla CBS 200.50]
MPEPSEPTVAAAPTETPSSPSQPIPSSPRPSPPPIDTNRNSFVLPESSIMATTPAAMETAMRFDKEEVRKSLAAAAAATGSPTSPERPLSTEERREEENAITSTPPAAPAAPAPVEDTTPGIVITLLILSGARSTFTLNPGYLTRHNVPDTEPLQMTVYNLKECVWRDWKEEELNTKQPASPHLIRLISLGRLLEDKSLLRDCRLNLDTPNVVHLSLRPADITEDEVTSKSGKFTGFNSSGNRTGERASAGCWCVIL